MIARLLATCLLALCGPAMAHGPHAGSVDIADDGQGNVEVIHVYQAHDLAAALENLYGRTPDLGDPIDAALLRKLVDSQFWLAGRDGRRLPLAWIDLDLDGDNLTLRQRIPATSAAQVETIHDGVLADFLPDQANTVNLFANGSARSFGFTAARRELSVH